MEPGAWGTWLTEPIGVTVTPRTSPAPPRPQRTPAPQVPHTHSRHRHGFRGSLLGHRDTLQQPLQSVGLTLQVPQVTQLPSLLLPHPRSSMSSSHCPQGTQQLPGVTPTQLGPSTESRSRAGDSHGWEGGGDNLQLLTEPLPQAHFHLWESQESQERQEPTPTARRGCMPAGREGKEEQLHCWGTREQN